MALGWLSNDYKRIKPTSSMKKHMDMERAKI